MPKKIFTHYTEDYQSSKTPFDIHRTIIFAASRSIQSAKPKQYGDISQNTQLTIKRTANTTGSLLIKVNFALSI